MLNAPNRPPGTTQGANSRPVTPGPVPVSDTRSGSGTGSRSGSQTGWQARLNTRRLSRQKLRHLAVLWGLLTLLCLPTLLLAPGWFYIVLAAGLYRLAYLAGLDIKLKPGKLVRKILVVLIFMALILWFIRTETSKFASWEVTPSSPTSMATPVQPGSPAPLKFHP